MFKLRSRPWFLFIVPLILAVTMGVFYWLLPVQSQHRFRRVWHKTRTKVASLTGKHPQLAAISGQVPEPGMIIQTLDSPSGWAACADGEGKFRLAEELCYPGAEVELLLVGTNGVSKRLNLVLPKSQGGQAGFVLDRLPVESAETVDRTRLQGINTTSWLDFDRENLRYYTVLFEKITEGRPTDVEKLVALNNFVAAKLNFDEATADYQSPRQVLERGSKYCGPLSLALATLAKAGGYETRILHLRTAGPLPNFHAVVEVKYGGSWHVFDATYGIAFPMDNGEIAGYRDLRLNAKLVTPQALNAIAPRARRSGYAWVPNTGNSVFVFLVEPRDFDGINQWMPSLYASGMFHEFYFK